MGIKKLSVIAFLAICNVVWFYNFTLGSLKLLLLVIICISNHKIIFDKKSYVGLPVFIWIILSIVVNITLHNGWKGNLFDSSGAVFYIYGFIENYLFFVIGYNFFRRNIISLHFWRLVPCLIIPLCTIVIVNFFTGIPNWYSPDEINRVNNGYNITISPLYSTGFGVARTGWANSLCQFLPLVLLYRKPWQKIGGFAILLFAICISGSRGGMLCALIMLLLFISNVVKSLNVKIPLVFVMVIGIMILYISWDEISMILRLSDNEDLSTGRIEQYALLPEILPKFNLGGLGINGILMEYQRLGINYTLHNTYIRLMLELGVLFAIPFIVLLFKVCGTIAMSMRDKERDMRIIGLILVTGLVSGFFEPQAVFGAANWYSIWWFVFGVLYARAKYRNRHNPYLSNLNCI